MDDREIIGLFWRRDPAALRETAAAYGARLHRLAAGILKNGEDAEEIVNDTYFKAWNAIPPERPRFLFAYLAKICRFAAFDRLDRSQAAKRSAEIVELTAEMELCIPGDAVERQLESEEIARLLNRFLGTLSEESRRFFVLRYWYADSVRSISERCGVSESRIKVSLYRTRKKLRHYLESEDISL